MDDLVTAFSCLPREQRQAIAHEAKRVRDERSDGPWRTVFALVANAAYDSLLVTA